MPDDGGFSAAIPPWPSLSALVMPVGGITVTYDAITAAITLLAASRTSAIAPVLSAASSPLAGCDYFAVAAPYLDTVRKAPKTGRRGAAGRHVVKNALIMALTAKAAAAREQEIAMAMAAFATDERYAEMIARDASLMKERAFTAGLRSSLRSAVARAVTACGRASGEFECHAKTACGTGTCRFSSPAYRGVTAIAGPGRFTRPRNHDQAGSPFTEKSAFEQLSATASRRAGVQVSDSDALSAGGKAA